MKKEIRPLNYLYDNIWELLIEIKEYRNRTGEEIITYDDIMTYRLGYRCGDKIFQIRINNLKNSLGEVPGIELDNREIGIIGSYFIESEKRRLVLGLLNDGRDYGLEGYIRKLINLEVMI